jgi:hypothetical protein
VEVEWILFSGADHSTRTKNFQNLSKICHKIVFCHLPLREIGLVGRVKSANCLEGKEEAGGDEVGVSCARSWRREGA